MPAIFTHILSIAIVGVSLALMLTRPRGIPEVYWVGAGALLLVLLRLIPLKLAGRAVAAGLDVYLFLAGMMLLSEVAREHGVFDWLSSAAVRSSRGSCSRLFVLVYGIGAAVTVSLSNDATAVVLTPAVLAAVRKGKVDPLPYLFACAMIANAASFVLPISNPANLVVFHAAMPPLARWLASFLVPSIFSIAATYLVLRWYFRKELRGFLPASAPAAEAHPLDHQGKLVLTGLGLVVAVLLTASAYGKDLGLPTCVAALAITAIVSWRAKANPLKLAREISWSTLALVAGLFVMVYAMESVGALGLMRAGLRWVAALPQAWGALAGAFAIGVSNNLVNNLPLGLITGSALRAAHATPLTANVALIGVDLGPNLSVTGSLATVLWLIALRKEKLHVSAWDFLKAGALAMPIALLAAAGGAIAMNVILRS